MTGQQMDAEGRAAWGQDRPPQEISLVVPVKELSRAKSRLELPVDVRRHIAYSMALRTLTVATTCLPPGQVFVVTRDPQVAALSKRLGATRVRERAMGLNPALEVGVAAAMASSPGHAVVVMVADLPGLTVTGLTAMLTTVEDAGHQPLVVPDRSGRGTTLVSMPPGRPLPMVFGHESSARFGALGCLTANNAPDCVRADLDTLGDLVATT